MAQAIPQQEQQMLAIPLAELPPRFGRAVRVEGHHIAVFRLASGEVRAVENRCPHRGGPLAEGIVSGEHVYCPLHDWKICLTDGKVQPPDSGCVRTYRTQLRGEMVYIYL